MSLFSTIKQNARLALGGSWGKAVPVLLISGGVFALLAVMQAVCIRLFVVPQMAYSLADNAASLPQGEALWWFVTKVAPAEFLILAVFSVLSVLLMAPVLLGATHWFYALTGGDKPAVGGMFRFFDSFGGYRKAIWYYIQSWLRSLLWSILFYSLPCVLGGVAMTFLSRAEGDMTYAYMATIALMVAVLAVFLASVLYMIFMQRYALVPYLLCEDDAIRVRDAFRQSVRFTRGYRGSLFLLLLSFVGWMLLTALTFGLLGLYVGPYYSTAHALYARFLVQKNRETQSGNATKEFRVGGDMAAGA